MIMIYDLEIDNCNIEFKDVNFKYEATRDRALNNISLFLKGGKSVHL